MTRNLFLFAALLLASISSAWSQTNPTCSFSICEAGYEADSGFQKFQICISASDTGYFHSRGQVYVEIGGTSLAAIPDSQILIIDGPLLSAQLAGVAMPKYKTINTVKNGQMLVVTYQTNFFNQPGSSAMHVELPLTPTVLYEIRIPAKEPLTAQLKPNLMRGQTFFAPREGGIEQAFGEGEW